MRVLVTGAAGFIGSHVARLLADNGYEVVAVDDLSTGKRSRLLDGSKFIEGDLRDQNFVSRLPRDIDRILHLAGQSSGELSFRDPQADLARNTLATLNLIDFAIKSGVPRITYASSMSVYGDVEVPVSVVEETTCRPLSCYGAGKLASENYLRIFSNEVESISFRMFNVYGPGQDLDNLAQGMVSIYLAMALRTGKVTVKGGLQRFRDFVFIDDVAKAWVRSLDCELPTGSVINLGTGKPTTVGDLLSLIDEILGGVEVEVVNPTPGDQSGISADVSRLGEIIDVRSFVSLREGLERFIDWARVSL